MSKVRIIIQGPVADHEAFTDFAKRACAFVEQNEPHALAYEYFASEESGHAILHEMYTDPDAFVTHFQNLTETGMLDELLQVFTPEQVTLLNRITDPRVKEIAQQFGAKELSGVAGVVR